MKENFKIQQRGYRTLDYREQNTVAVRDRELDSDTHKHSKGYGSEEDDRDDVINFEEHVQVVSFIIGSEEYAIDILHIHEINKIVQITRLPNVPPFILGIMNLRGNVIPVVDLRVKFGLTKKDFDDDTRAIVVEVEQKLVALIVDSVHQSLRLRKSDVEFASEMITGISADYISGVAKYKNRLVILLKMSSVLMEEQSENDKIFSQLSGMPDH